MLSISPVITPLQYQSTTEKTVPVFQANKKSTIGDKFMELDYQEASAKRDAAFQRTMILGSSAILAATALWLASLMGTFTPSETTPPSELSSPQTDMITPQQ